MNYWLCLLWLFDLWTVKAFLDLDAFPHISQKWTTPVIWCASMCFLTASFIPSFLHKLHSQFLPWKVFSLLHIIELIWSSKFLRLTVLSELSIWSLSGAFAVKFSTFSVKCGLKLLEVVGTLKSESKAAKFGSWVPVSELFKFSSSAPFVREPSEDLWSRSCVKRPTWVGFHRPNCSSALTSCCAKRTTWKIAKPFAENSSLGFPVKTRLRRPASLGILWKNLTL